MDGACRAYGGKGKVHTEFWYENMKEKEKQEDLGVDGRTILKWIFIK
jgi:hypothetical protein